MARLTTLLEKLTGLHRQHAQIEHQIAAIEREIVTAGKPERRRKRKTISEVGDLAMDLLKVLQGADEPLPPREIASRLGIAPAALGYRLRQAVAARFVEKIGFGRYRISSAVPTL